MAWNGSGTYNKGNLATGGWVGDAAASIPIQASRHDTQDNDFATGINNCLAKDGQNAMTADLNVGGQRIRNVALGTAALPAIYPSTDSNTGIYSPGADTLGFATGGVDRLQISTTAITANNLQIKGLAAPTVGTDAATKTYVDGKQRLLTTANRSVRSVSSWSTQLSAYDGDYRAICFSSELGLFVAVNSNGNGAVLATSPNGVTWTQRVSVADTIWESVCWSPELSLFCALSASGATYIMTSPDGVTWTARTGPAQNTWGAIVWAPDLGLFCAVGRSGTGNRVMTSPDGITWTLRASAADSAWVALEWAPEIGLFIAGCQNSAAVATQRIMTSPDGITWTIRTTPDTEVFDIAWSPTLGLAVGVSTYNGIVITSNDGITWTSRAVPTSNKFNGVAWSEELGVFCAVSQAGTGNRVMTSLDGITWTSRSSAADNTWQDVCYAPELGRFVAIANSGVGNRVMTQLDTGVYKPGQRVNKYNQLFLTQKNIGINAPNPLHKLHVISDSTATSPAFLQSNATGDVARPSLLCRKFDNNSTTSQIFVQFEINNTNTGSGQINANGASQAAFGTYSDVTLKENIVDLPSTVESFKALRPVEFDYLDGSGHQIGFVAQEVANVFPDLVNPDENGLLMVSGLGKNEARLIRALQELILRVETLEAEIKVLKGE